MAVTAEERDWYLDEIRRLDPNSEVVSIVTSAGVPKLRYVDAFRSDETLLRQAEAEELVRALTVCKLCDEAYGYQAGRMYLEQTHSIGRPSTSRAQIDLVLYFGEEDGSETVFAMWEMKAADMYRPSDDALIKDQLFSTAPLVSPSLLVYSTYRPGADDLECITIDYKAHKSYERWDADGRPAT